MKLLRKRGQSMGEYAILFAIVLGAIVAMQAYIRDRIAGKLAVAADAYAKAGLVSGGLATLNTTSDSQSNTKAIMTKANVGNVGSTSNGVSTVTAPR